MAKRLVNIDVMQGLAMILVVLGHHRFDFMPQWYIKMFYWIYTFHMPLFIFISGFLIRYSYKKVYDISEYKSYIGKRAKKFIPPYLIIGTVCTILVWNFKDISTLLISWSNLLIAPKQSEVTFLWYIYLLFIFYCISPLIFNAKQSIRILLFIIALILSLCYNSMPYLCIDYFTRYFVFFIFGVLIAEHYTQIKQIDIRWTILAIIIFVTMSTIHFKYGYNPFLEYAIQWMGIPTFACIAWILMQWQSMRNILVYISINCFGVYLLHMFFVQVGAMIVTHLPIEITSFGYIIYLVTSVTISIGATAWLWSKHI